MSFIIWLDVVKSFKTLNHQDVWKCFVYRQCNLILLTFAAYKFRVCTSISTNCKYLSRTCTYASFKSSFWASPRTWSWFLLLLNWGWILFLLRTIILTFRGLLVRWASLLLLTEVVIPILLVSVVWGSFIVSIIWWSFVVSIVLISIGSPIADWLWSIVKQLKIKRCIIPMVIINKWL